VGVETVSVVRSEYGPDLTQFPTEKHFVSHMRLAPHQPTSGGKLLKHHKKPAGASARVAAALRMAAVSLRHSQTALGAYYRQVARRAGAQVAVFATARKLAQLIYRLLRRGQPYVDEGAAAYDRRYHEARVRRLATTANTLGYKLVPAEPPCQPQHGVTDEESGDALRNQRRSCSRRPSGRRFAGRAEARPCTHVRLRTRAPMSSSPPSAPGPGPSLVVRQF
jgi:hypothetical protein